MLDPMRNKIDIKRNGRETLPSARSNLSEFLNPARMTPPPNPDDSIQVLEIVEPAPAPPQTFQQRASSPLKIVFITQIESPAEDVTVSACRRLANALTARGHRLLILERNVKPRQTPPGCGQTLF